MTARGSAWKHAAQHKGAGAKRQLLFPGITLFPNKRNQFKLLEPARVDVKTRQDLAYRGERRIRCEGNHRMVAEWSP